MAICRKVQPVVTHAENTSEVECFLYGPEHSA